MKLLFLILCAMLVDVSFGLPAMDTDQSIVQKSNYSFPFITRKQWGGNPPEETIPLSVPVPYVVIHHSYIPPACYTREDCAKAMRTMQDMHVIGNGWVDIGYNFAVGSDGAAYEGRGWDVLGAHALNFNTVSIGICLIGDWRHDKPVPDQLKVAQQLIAAGVELGYIRKDYILVGHRQVRETECPGDALFEEIGTWPNFSNYPRSVDDLNDVLQNLKH